MTRGDPAVTVLPDAEAATDAAAAHIAATLQRAVEARGRADWATTGGSAAAGIYRRLAAEPLRSQVPWDRVHTWWGDDRFARRGDPQSNVTPADEHLIGPLALGASRVHPIPVDASADNAAAADAYAAELRGAGLPQRDGYPALDLVVLGIGPDGHLLSVFPGSEAFDDARWVLPIPAPTHVEPHVERVTLNPRVIDVAADVLVVAFGEGKAETLGRVFADERDPRELPARVARRVGATWLLDEAAATALPAHLRRG